MANKLKDILRKKLTKKELSLVPSSFDIIGNTLIFHDFPEKLSKKEEIMANEILKAVSYTHLTLPTTPYV